MSSDTTPATWAFHLRGTQTEKDIVQRTIDAHAAAGIKISMNQAVLILIRRAATPDADTEEEARAQIERHWATCPLGCDVATIKCADGWRLRDVYQRLRSARPVALAPAPEPSRPARAFPPFPISRSSRVQP